MLLLSLLLLPSDVVGAFERLLMPLLLLLQQRQARGQPATPRVKAATLPLQLYHSPNEEHLCP